MNIDPSKVDKLNQIALNLAIITHLHRLVLNKYEVSNEIYSPIKINTIDIFNYISDLQVNYIKELQNLIYDENFTNK